MNKPVVNKMLVSLIVNTFFVLSFANSTNAFPRAVSTSSATEMKTSLITRLTAVCDTTKSNYGLVCSADEIQAILKPLMAQKTDIEKRFASLVASNIELSCGHSLEQSDPSTGYSDFGPCFGNFNEVGSKDNLLFFPCSKPNPRFEQAFPPDYWEGYYEAVDRSQMYGGCSKQFTGGNGNGAGYTFSKVWERRWALIYPAYQSLASEYEILENKIQPINNELTRAKSIPPSKPGDCPWNRSDPTEGFLAKGKTAVDAYGYKFTCRNSSIQRTGRVALKAIDLSCPEYDSPTGNTCSVRTSWGTSSQLTRVARYAPVGKVVDTGWYVSLSGYKCAVKLYANFAFRETCK